MITIVMYVVMVVVCVRTGVTGDVVAMVSGLIFIVDVVMVISMAVGINIRHGWPMLGSTE